MEDKINKSLSVISKVFKKYQRNEIGAFWSGGKDSTTMLSLVRLYNAGTLPIKVVGIDEGLFKENYDFIDSLKEAWNMDFMWYRDNSFFRDLISTKKKSETIAHFKTDAISRVIDSFGWKAVFVGIRSDEHEARKKERYFSRRRGHLRIHPLLHWSEIDIWDYLRKNNIPYPVLYDMGFRSLGAECLTAPAKNFEREGRIKDNLMYVLRQFGYF